MTDLTTFDRLKGAALIGTFIGVLITFVMWVSLWDSVWRTAGEPTRVNIYNAEIFVRSITRLAFGHYGCGGGRRVVD